MVPATHGSRLQQLLVLWLAWWIGGGLLLVLGLLVHSGWGDVRGLWSQLRHFSWRDVVDISILFFYWSPAAVILGGGQYLKQRVSADSGPAKSVWPECGFVMAVCLMLSASLGFMAWRHFEVGRLRGAAWGDSMEVYERLARAGRHQELVRRMEEDCERFNDAKRRLKGEITVHSCNHGFSYLFCNLYGAWDSTIRLAPYSVLACLESVRFDQSHKPNERGEYGPWGPIAEEVSKSDTLILRALGCAMLEDHAGYAETAYVLAEVDADALPLAAHAAMLDPDAARGVDRMLRYRLAGVYRSGNMQHMVDRENLDRLLITNTAKALDAGQCDESMKAKLRELPWTRQLSEPHRKLLGLVD